MGRVAPHASGDIWGIKYLSKAGADAQLKLYHEVTVAAASEQYFEYCNCHSKTGILRSFRLET